MVRVIAPLLAITVNVYVPCGVVFEVLMVSTALALAINVEELKVAEPPGIDETPSSRRVTAPLKPPRPMVCRLKTAAPDGSAVTTPLSTSSQRSGISAVTEQVELGSAAGAAKTEAVSWPVTDCHWANVPVVPVVGTGTTKG